MHAHVIKQYSKFGLLTYNSMLIVHLYSMVWVCAMWHNAFCSAVALCLINLPEVQSICWRISSLFRIVFIENLSCWKKCVNLFRNVSYLVASWQFCLEPNKNLWPKEVFYMCNSHSYFEMVPILWRYFENGNRISSCASSVISWVTFKQILPKLKGSWPNSWAVKNRFSQS